MKHATILISQCKIPSWANVEHLAHGISLLPATIHSEINCYRHLEDRFARLAGRLLVSKALHSFGFENASTLDLWRKDSNGRPFIEDCRADFSISHANPWVVTAVGVNCKVGIDVELFHKIEIDAFTPYLTLPEIEHIENSKQPEVETLHCWSKREAILKADGRGLLVSENIIRNLTSSCSPEGGRWHLQNLSFNHGCLYLASNRQRTSLLRKEWMLTELLVPYS